MDKIQQEIIDKLKKQGLEIPNKEEIVPIEEEIVPIEKTIENKPKSKKQEIEPINIRLKISRNVLQKMMIAYDSSSIQGVLEPIINDHVESAKFKKLLNEKLKRFNQ